MNLRPVDGTLSVILPVSSVSLPCYVHCVLSDKIVEGTADHFDLINNSV